MLSKTPLAKDLGHVQAHTLCHGFRVEHMFPEKVCNGIQIRFLLFGGVKNVSPISSNMYINHAVLKRQLAQWVK